MCTNFECFTEINGEKHTIIINKDINSVQFIDIYYEIMKIDAKQNISFEKNIFEVFDVDLNEYKRIESSQQLIKYLSRIRVSPKTQINEHKIENKLIDKKDNNKSSTKHHFHNDYKNTILSKSKTIVKPFTHSSKLYSERQSLSLTSTQTQPLYRPKTRNEKSPKTNFICFVDINNNKYEIKLNKDINNVMFSDVYQQILKINSKQNNSFETNTYEVFDSNLKQYKRIISAQQLIANNSRIRVLLKPQFFASFLNTENNAKDYQKISDQYKSDANQIRVNKSELLYSRRKKVENNPYFNSNNFNPNPSNNNNDYKYANDVYLSKTQTIVNTLSHSSPLYSRRPLIRPSIPSNSFKRLKSYLYKIC